MVDFFRDYHVASCFLGKEDVGYYQLFCLGGYFGDYIRITCYLICDYLDF